MPRYFFDLRDGGWTLRDVCGIDLPDDEAARRHVDRILLDIARRGLPRGNGGKFECDARTEDGASVYNGSLTYRGLGGPVDPDL